MIVHLKQISELSEICGFFTPHFFVAFSRFFHNLPESNLQFSEITKVKAGALSDGWLEKHIKVYRLPKRKICR